MPSPWPLLLRHIQPRHHRRRRLVIALTLGSLLLTHRPGSASPAAGRPRVPAELEAILPADLRSLVQQLARHGFRLLFAAPPEPGAYGQFVPASRTLYLAPISLELGIARQTLLHEAVHAAQSCPDGRLTPIGWSLRLDPVVNREISAILLRGYHHSNRLLEREAFAMQGQPDAVGRILAALRSRCRRQG